MPLQERKAFIADPKEGMTTREKNMHLSAKLAVAPHANRMIVRIERIEIAASGWWIHYRTGSA
jgi:hypothetical protein